MDADDYLFMSSSLFTHCCSEYIIYFLILKSYIIFTHVHIICLLEKVEYHDKKNQQKWYAVNQPIFNFWFLCHFKMIIFNGANRGIKAVLHIVNKFGAGHNNVAHLCI